MQSITSENLILDSIKLILICIVFFLCMAKATNVKKTKEKKLVQDESLLSVQDAPIRKLIYACLKLVQDEPVIWRRSPLVSVKDEPVIYVDQRLNLRRSTLVSVQDEPVLWCRSTLVSVQDEPVLWCRSTLVSVKDEPTLVSVQDEPVLWCRSTLVSEQDEPVLWCRSTLVSEQDEPVIWPRSKLVSVKDEPTIPRSSLIDLRNNKECTVCKKELKKEVTHFLTKKVSLPITLEQYSEKSFVVRGDTFEHKDKLAELGGKWNKFLTDKQTDSRFCAWVFSNSKKLAVQEFLRLSRMLPATTAGI